jgi:hypothetical protein
MGDEAVAPHRQPERGEENVPRAAEAAVRV